jgi:hypothetical protein
VCDLQVRRSRIIRVQRHTARLARLGRPVPGVDGAAPLPEPGFEVVITIKAEKIFAGQGDGGHGTRGSQARRINGTAKWA